MNRLAVAALSGLLIAFVHAFAAPSAHAQCTFQNPVTNLNDGDGFLWDIQSNGTVVNGTGDSWDIGMGLFVDNVAYPFQGSLSTELSGRQVLVGPAAMSGLNVTRRVFVPTTDGWARWFDSFEPESEPVDYGLTKNIDTFNPVKIAFHEWAAMFRDARHADTWRDSASYLLQPPGWSPDRSTQTAREMQADLL